MSKQFVCWLCLEPATRDDAFRSPQSENDPAELCKSCEQDTIALMGCIGLRMVAAVQKNPADQESAIKEVIEELLDRVLPRKKNHS